MNSRTGSDVSEHRSDKSVNAPAAAPVAGLRTARLILRAWRHEDLEPFAALNADPAVMEHFPGTLTRAASDAAAAHIRAELAERGFGLWAVEVPGEAEFVGFTGLSVVRFDAPFTRAAQPSEVIEVGWRIARAHWGRGYAPEAAQAALRYGFEALGLGEIVAFTAIGNTRSRRVMEKLGMTHEPADDFEHPNLAPAHPLRRHVLYRATARRRPHR